MRRINNAIFGWTIICLAAINAQAAIQATYYASPTGSGSTCSQAQPGSLTSVRDKVRTVNKNMTGDIVVNLRGGTYPLSATFNFGSQDGGTNGHSVIYQAYPGETPVLSGGRQISGWTLSDAGKNIYKASVTAGWEFRQLYVNGERGIRARSPNMTNPATKGPYYLAKTKDAPFVIDASEAGNWQNLNQVEMCWLGNWHHKRARINRFDFSGNEATVRFLNPELGSGVVNQFNQAKTYYFFENAYEFLDAEGEWYLNTGTSTVYYKPCTGQNLSSAQVTAPRLERLMDISGTSLLRISGVTFEYSNWTKPNTFGFLTWQSAAYLETDNLSVIPGAVCLENTDNVVVDRCTIRHTGAHGLLVEGSSGANNITGNVFQDLSAGGVTFTRASGDLIKNNLVANYGEDYTEGVGVFVMRTSNTTITHNEIRDGGWTGISFGWSWNDSDMGDDNNNVSFNRIYRILRALDDGAAIYSLGRMNNTSIHDNYISDLSRSQYASGCPLAGIYLDAGCSYKTVRNNVLDSCNEAFYAFNEPNHNNTIELNYYNCTRGKIATRNTFQSNTVVTGTQWPAAARAIMTAAGIEKPVTGLKPQILAQETIFHTVSGGPNTAVIFDAQGRLVMRALPALSAESNSCLGRSSAMGLRLVRMRGQTVSRLILK
jgi:hypothetical protein